MDKDNTRIESHTNSTPLKTLGEKDRISLKWGSLKSWDFQTGCCRALFEEWAKLGFSLSATAHRDTPEQKKLLCEIIDAANTDTIYLDWDGKDVSKDEAKEYVMSYGNPNWPGSGARVHLS